MKNLPGISGFAMYLPPLRVSLGDWCEWTGQPAGKVEKVVGTGFRMLHPKQDAYCMAANAVLSLIENYAVEPERVGQLILATESSQDNAIGAVIVRGLVDQALEADGKAPLARDIEVPEIKQACIAGFYGLQQAIRYLATDGGDRVSIVVATDIAEYQRGSSGEQTQGAGAVAALLEPQARLLQLDLLTRGDASAYRGPDFRKPMHRYMLADYQVGAERYHDFPVFSGRFSTFAYIDATLNAFKRHLHKVNSNKSKRSALECLSEYRAIFFHRPYRYMPIQGLSYLYLYCLLDEAGQKTLNHLCDLADCSPQAVCDELNNEPDLHAHMLRYDAQTTPYPSADKVAGILRRDPAFINFVNEKTLLGARATAEFGNLYSAALTAWLAAGLNQAANDSIPLNDKDLLAIGYGSGDAALAIRMQVVDNWEQAAGQINIQSALDNTQRLSRADYEQLHDTADLELSPPSGCYIDHYGDSLNEAFQDIGIAYYHAEKP